jgi:hypothetical protein
MDCIMSDISKSECKLVTSQNIKCEKTSKPIKKTLIIKKVPSASAKVLKQKASLMRYKASSRDRQIEVSEGDNHFNDISAPSTNVVISHIENFVRRKNLKEVNKRLIHKLLKIRQRESRIDYKPSFLDMPSLWTD